MTRLLFIGFLVRDEDASSIFASEQHPQVSAVRYQRNMLLALEQAGAEIEALTTPPIAPFPRSRLWWVPGVSYTLLGFRLRGRQFGGPNLSLVRLLSRLIQVIRCGRQAPPHDAMLVYSAHTPMVAGALVLKWLRGTPLFVVIPDLPTFMGGPTNRVKRLLKRIDSALVRRLLRRANGAFPVTEGTGRDWLRGKPRYWPVGGISDEAAAVLTNARANGSFVYRGAGRPVLLYTGMLAWLMPFARAFHRSPIEASIVFMGGGEDAEALRALASVDRRIQVTGFATGASFDDEIARADFMLNARDPAWSGAAYSFPWKVFDYLTTGKPIVSTRLSGLPDEYFAVFRTVDMSDQASFEASLRRALSPDRDPEPIWEAAERLGERLTSGWVGTQLLNRMREWSGRT
jgi:glycosyltransferase involved in cell wall biosynthesis